MRLAELWRYPVKSMAGERLGEAVLGPLGIPGDRRLVVTDEAGRILTSRTKPELLRMHPTLDEQGVVQVDGLAWADARVASRVREAAGDVARLILLDGPEHFDGLPLLVATDGAIESIALDLRRFRPNLLIGDVPGLAERSWEGKFLAIGDAVIGIAELRERCIMTTWDPDTIEQDVEVLKRIRRDYDGCFALDAWVARAGRVAVGDPVTLLDEFDDAEPPLLGRYAR